MIATFLKKIKKGIDKRFNKVYIITNKNHYQ